MRQQEQRMDTLQLFIEHIENTLVQTLTPNSPYFILACRTLSAGRVANLLPVVAAADVMQ